MVFKQVNNNNWQLIYNSFDEIQLEIFANIQGTFTLVYDIAINEPGTYPIVFNNGQTNYQIKVDGEIILTTHNFTDLEQEFIQSIYTIMCNDCKSCNEISCSFYLKALLSGILLYESSSYSREFSFEDLNKIKSLIESLVKLSIIDPLAFSKEKYKSVFSLLYRNLLKQKLFYSLTLNTVKEDWRYEIIQDCSECITFNLD